MSISSRMSGGATTAMHMAECWRCMLNLTIRLHPMPTGRLQKLCVTISKRNTHAPGMKPNSGRPAQALQLQGPGLPLPAILLPSEKQYHSRIRPVQRRSTRRYPCCLLNLRCGRHIGNICAPLNAGCLMNRLTHWDLRAPHRLFYAGLPCYGRASAYRHQR